MTPKEHANLVKKSNQLLDLITDLVVLINNLVPTPKVAAIHAPKGKPKGKGKSGKPKAAVKNGSAKPKKAKTKPKERKNVTLESVFAKQAN